LNAPHGRRPAAAGARWAAVLLAAGVALAPHAGAAAARAVEAPAAGGAAPAAAAPPPTAVVGFVAAAGGAGLPVPAARLRAEGAAALAAALQARGRAAPLAIPLLPYQREWRVRQAFALPHAFVAALAGRAGAQRVVVAQFVAADGRLLLAARSLSPATGLVTWADLADAPLPAAADTAAFWRRTVPELASTLAERWREPPPRADADTLGVLPAEALGCHAWEAEAATYALLRGLLAERRHHVPDPGLLVAALQDEGLAATRPGAAALRAVARRHGAARVLLSALQALAPAAPGAAPGAADDGAAASGVLTDLVLAARIVAADGSVVEAAATAASPAPAGAGWFGAVQPYSPARRLTLAGHEVLMRCRNHREDS
jgi:hypothetical protein